MTGVVSDSRQDDSGSECLSTGSSYVCQRVTPIQLFFPVICHGFVQGLMSVVCVHYSPCTEHHPLKLQYSFGHLIPQQHLFSMGYLVCVCFKFTLNSSIAVTTFLDTVLPSISIGVSGWLLLNQR